MNWGLLGWIGIFTDCTVSTDCIRVGQILNILYEALHEGTTSDGVTKIYHVGNFKKLYIASSHIASVAQHTLISSFTLLVLALAYSQTWTMFTLGLRCEFWLCMGLKSHFTSARAKNSLCSLRYILYCTVHGLEYLHLTTCLSPGARQGILTGAHLGRCLPRSDEPSQRPKVNMMVRPVKLFDVSTALRQCQEWQCKTR